MRWFFWGLISLIFGVALLGAAVGPQESGQIERGPQLSEEQRAARAAEAAELARTRQEQMMRVREMLRPPQDQERFVTAVTDGIVAFRNAGSDQFAQGATRPARRDAICAVGLGRNPQVREWVGTVSRKTTNNEGRGVLHVRLSDTVTLTTWNNAFSDVGDRTLVEPGSAVFHAMAQLGEGTPVRFSGRFIPHPTDCVREASMTIRGSMTAPEFVFRFESLRPAL